MKEKSVNKIKKIGAKTLSGIGFGKKIIDPPSSESNKPLVYFAKNQDIKLVNEIENDLGIELPNDLVIEKGAYNFYNKTYDLKEEGVYRFVYPEKINQQRIVYEKDLDSLLSAICWISSHGNTDDGKDFLEINNKVLNSKIFLTCGPKTEWIENFLSKYSVKCRIVASLTLEKWNSYDNGHVMIEIFREDLKKWILYDLDNNCFFEKNKKQLSFIEFFSCVKDDNYEIKYLAPQSNIAISNFIDSKSNFDFNFILETKLLTEKLRRKWYKRVIQVLLITDGDYNYFFDETNRNHVEKYSSYYKFLKQDDFMEKFYS